MDLPATPLAADLAAGPSTDLTVQLCGDAHVANFGLFGSAERRLLFDFDDFDETYPGPFEWDLKRLVASLDVAARDNGFGRRDRARIVRGTVKAYARAMAGFADMSTLDVWYARADVDEAAAVLRHTVGTPPRRTQSEAAGRGGARARRRDVRHAPDRLTEVVDGRRRFVSDPPAQVPLTELLPPADQDAAMAAVREIVQRYRVSLISDRRRLLCAYRVIDVAQRVVGVGSVGTRCWVALLAGVDDEDLLVLQVKEAVPAVLAAYLPPPAPPAAFSQQGERVVAGQRLMQAASDIALGWYRAPHWLDGNVHDFSVRELRDRKGSARLERMDPDALRDYGRLCGRTVARAHARSGDRRAIAAYLRDGRDLARALVDFAEAAADRTEADLERFRAAMEGGLLSTGRHAGA